MPTPKHQDPKTITSRVGVVATPLSPGTYLPELLRSILTSNALQDLRAAGVLVNELGDVVNGRVDDNVHALIGVVVGGDLGRGEGLGRHGGRCVGGVRLWVEI